MIVGAVVLAAGRSTRMPGPSKLVADLNGRAVVAHVVAAVAAAGLPRAVVVVGDRADAVRAALAGDGVEFVDAPDYADGLSASLRAGIAAVPDDWSAVLVLLGDMPRVHAATLVALAKVATATTIAVPVHAGQRGNPVLWGAAYFAELRELAGDVGGKVLLARHADHIVEVAVDDEGVLIDVDTPAALAALRS